MKIGYLEIVTPDVVETCALYERAYGVCFTDPIPSLGNARTVKLSDGGRLGIREPMRDSELPVVRPYFVVENVAATLSTIEASGGQIAVPAMELPGEGICAIYLLGGIDHGIWQEI